MSATSPHIASAPFDSLADQYDRVFSESKIGQAQRTLVWREVAEVFRPGDRVLDIGCGTGVDACFLAQRGVNVVAFDSSERMIEVTARRVKREGLEHRVRTRVLAAEEMCILPSPMNFDGAFSNFGVLNCVTDLRALARDLANLLRPGAAVLFCVIGSCCAWEIAWYLAQGRPAKAFRRLHRGGVMARFGDATIRLHYPSVRSLAHMFSPEFRLTWVKGIGLSIPPTYMEGWAGRHPRWFHLCQQADSLLANCPRVRRFADHLLLRFERGGA